MITNVNDIVKYNKEIWICLLRHSSINGMIRNDYILHILATVVDKAPTCEYNV